MPRRWVVSPKVFIYYYDDDDGHGQGWALLGYRKVLWFTLVSPSDRFWGWDGLRFHGYGIRDTGCGTWWLPSCLRAGTWNPCLRLTWRGGIESEFFESYLDLIICDDMVVLQEKCRSSRQLDWRTIRKNKSGGWGMHDLPNMGMVADRPSSQSNNK